MEEKLQKIKKIEEIGKIKKMADKLLKIGKMEGNGRKF